MIAFIDDLVLLASSTLMLQRAIDITLAWANKMRIRINVGAGKRTSMVWGRGSSPDEWHNWICKIGRRDLPRVNVYKYMGVFISSGNSASHHVKHIATKAHTKSFEIMAWARAHNVALDITLRV